MTITRTQMNNEAGILLARAAMALRRRGEPGAAHQSRHAQDSALATIIERYVDNHEFPEPANPGAPELDVLDARYRSLYRVLHLAYQQAANGKGAQRHGLGTTPFEDQPMQTICRLLDSNSGMAYQAIKKVQEAMRMDDRDRQIRELLGAINYVAGLVIWIEDRQGHYIDPDSRSRLSQQDTDSDDQK